MPYLPLAIACVLLLTAIVVLRRRPARHVQEIPLSSVPLDALEEKAQQSARAANGRATLPKLTMDEKHIRLAFVHLGQAQMAGKALLPISSWFAEQGRIVQERTLRTRAQNLAAAKLPSLDGTARILTLSRDYLAHTFGQIAQDSLLAYLEAYQRRYPLSIQEMWALPWALRTALIERLSTLAKGSLDDENARREAEKWAAQLEKGTTPAASAFVKVAQSAAFVEHLVDCLRDSDTQQAITWLNQQIDAHKLDVRAIIAKEHTRQTAAQSFAGHAMASLYLLDHTDWLLLFEAACAAETVLRRDPSGIYPQMDAPSRDYYRKAVERLSRRHRLPEVFIAAKAVELAQKAGFSEADEPIDPQIMEEEAAPAEGSADILFCHIGYYLIGDGLPALRRALSLPAGQTPAKARESARQWYFFALAAGTVAFSIAALFFLPFWGVLLSIPLWIGVATELVHAVLTRTLPPDFLPKIKLRQLEDDQRTMVIMSVLLTSVQNAREQVAKLRSAAKANACENMLFLLLGDFADSAEPELEGDGAIVSAAREAIEDANKADGPRYFYVHRPRTLHPTQPVYMGWERKRGALMTVLSALNESPYAHGTTHFASNAHGNTHETQNFLSIDDHTAHMQRKYGFSYLSAPLPRCRFALTLDADTVAPHGSILKLVGAMVHPLQRGYGVLAPRMGLLCEYTTRFGKLFGGMRGVDTYVSAVSDVYQDLCGEGTYAGKGILDIAKFTSALRDQIPPNTVLSHDLLEGGYAGSGLCGDVVFYDGFPKTIRSFFTRQHRWTRGDWQLLPWLLGDAPISDLTRWKIFDNLRRSLLSVFTLALFVAGLFLGNFPAVVTALAIEFLPLILSLLNPSGFPLALARAVVSFLLWPMDAYTSADAAIRALYRTYVSHKHMLSWVTAAQSDQQKDAGRRKLALDVGFAMTLGIALLVAVPFNRPLLSLPAVLWIFVPSILRWLNQPSIFRQPLFEDDQVFLRDIAARTTDFFLESVTQEDHFLPPDNLQLTPNRGIAHRTSPTNIGLYLLSMVAAYELHFLTENERDELIARTLDTVEKLPKWHGHLYNWYNTQTLEVLRPRYVSSVDSGNLAACLMACSAALEGSPLALRLEKLVADMDLAKLYHAGRGLFAIGYDEENGQLASGCYDLLASEARLLSFVAVVTRQVPARHFARLSRTMVPAAGGKTLVSWSGTLFEYLMPQLLLPSYSGTLLSVASNFATRAQMQRGRRMGHPWGVSESGYYAFDLNMNYQYRAFGLHELALHPEGQDDVIAPYAAALALMVWPKHAADNLRRMERAGFLGRLGFFEAIDYTPERVEKGTYAIVHSHMAHHQGMALCAITNVLTENALVHAFLSRPDVQSGLFLLMERTPHGAALHPQRPQEAVQRPGFEPVRAARQAQASLPAQMHLLSGGGSTFPISASGDSALMRSGLYANRWRPEAGTRYGIRFYLQDLDKGSLLPLSGQGKLLMEAGRALTSLETDGIAVRLQHVISPESGALITNAALKVKGSGGARRLRLISFFEIALSTQDADSAHMAFQNLFIQTEGLENGVLALRRPRAQGDASPALCHVSLPAPTCVETRRDVLLGRAASSADWLPRHEGGLGAVLDPCASLAIDIELKGGEDASATFLTALCDDIHAAARAATLLKEDTFEHARTLALLHAQVELKFQHITAEKWTAFQRMLAPLLYLGLPKAHPALLKHGQPQSTLWGFGIPCDKPIILVRVKTVKEMPLVRDALLALESFFIAGLAIDLVLVNDYGNDYEQPVRDALRTEIDRFRSRGVSGRGEIYAIEGTALTDEQSTLLTRLSGVVLYGDKGSLTQQMALEPAADIKPATFAAPIPRRTIPLEPLALDNTNGLGGFDADGSYVIELKDGQNTPQPWVNILSNPDFGTVISERGAGYSFCGNSREHKLTPWSNDVLMDPHGEAIYLRDEEDGALWSPMPGPIRAKSPYRVRHSPGASTFEHGGQGLLQRTTVFVDRDWPMKITLLSLHNPGTAPRSLSVYAYAKWLLGNDARDALRLATGFFEKLCYARDAEGRTAYLAIAGAEEVHHTLDALAFQKHGLKTAVLDPKPSEGMPCAALQTRITLLPGETRELAILLGEENSPEDASARVRQLYERTASARLAVCLGDWQARLSCLVIQTPDENANRLCNVWLPYQAQSSRIWARTGFYQAGGAYGFRDQLQDMMAILHQDPAQVREHLIRSAAHQFLDGDVQHWWHPPYRGVRTHMTDDLLFLPFVVCRYIRHTGDEAVLEESIPYLENIPMEGKEDVYAAATPSDIAESLRIHCLRAIERVRLGQHGLPLMGAGDWNDAMNRVGAAGKGESVWLGMFYLEVIRLFLPFAPPNMHNALEERRTRLREALETHGWDGSWYRRAFYDSGEPLGSAQSCYCQIDALSQSWAALVGLDSARTRTAMASALEKLFIDPPGILALLAPPFDRPLPSLEKPKSQEPSGVGKEIIEILTPSAAESPDARSQATQNAPAASALPFPELPDAGYIQGYVPGVRENGGQYTHAAAWTVLALCALGDGDTAWHLFSRLMPCYHTSTPEDVARYRTEPYVVAADVYAGDHLGRGGWTWYTGSASWLYVAMVEGILGFLKTGGRVTLKPCLPSDWDDAALRVKGEQGWLTMRIKRVGPGNEVTRVLLNGRLQRDAWIDLPADGQEHQVVFEIGRR